MRQLFNKLFRREPKVTVPDFVIEDSKLFAFFVRHGQEIVHKYHLMFPNVGSNRHQISARLFIWEHDSDMDFSTVRISCEDGSRETVLMDLKLKHNALWLGCSGAELIPVPWQPTNITFGCVGLVCLTQGWQLESAPEIVKSLIRCLTYRFISYDGEVRATELMQELINEAIDRIA